jgi:hypothetical protein
MASDSGSSGILGVIVGVILVVAVAVGVLAYSGRIDLGGGSKTVNVDVKTPAVPK